MPDVSMGVSVGTFLNDTFLDRTDGMLCAVSDEAGQAADLTVQITPE